MKRGISENVAAPAAIPARVASADDWCILRTSGARTLPLASSLSAAGFDVWTPAETTSRRQPRSKTRVEREGPIMPTFVFARADRLEDLLQLLGQPLNPHPPFSVFRHGGRIPIIHDVEIGNLRDHEERARDRVRRAKRKGYRHEFAQGERVRVPEGSFAGMTGVVQDGDGKFAFVSFGGALRVKIATFLLVADQVETDQLCSSNAAKAA